MRCSSLVALTSILFVAVGIPATSLLATVQWSWQSPLPQGNDLGAVWGSSASDIFVVGEFGTILHWDGSDWSIQPTGTWYSFHDVWGTGPDNVWAVGNAGLILHYDGSSWTPFPSGTGGALHGIWGTSSSNIYAVGSFGTILRFNGTSWTKVNHGLTTSPLLAVWGSSASDVIVVGGAPMQGVVLHLEGGSWSKESLPVFDPQLNDVWGTGPDNVYAVGGGFLAGIEGPGTILRYDGSVWIEMHSPSEYYMSGVWGVDENAVFSVGAAGRVMRLNAGIWTTTDLGLGDFFHLFGVWGSSASDVWAVGTGGLIWRYDGNTWSQASAGFRNRITSVWGSSPSDLYVIRNETNIAGFITAYAVDHFDGTTWTKVWDGNKAAPLHAVWGSGPDDVFVVGGNGTWAVIVHYDGDGWGLMSPPMSSLESDDMYAVWGTGPDNVYAAGDRFILHYDGNSALTWTTEEQRAASFRGLWGSAANDIYASSASEILHYNGSSWEVSLPNASVSRVRGCGPGNVYAVGDDSRLLHRSGASWSQEASFLQNFPGYRLTDVWCSGPGDVFVSAVQDGSVFHYDGFHWTGVFHSSRFLDALWGNGSDEVYAVGDRGTVLQYGERPIVFQDGFESGDTSAWQ